MIASAAGGARRRNGLAQVRTAFFFESQPLAAQEQPHRVVRDMDPARSQFVLQPMQGQMRRLPDPLSDKVAMRFQEPLSVATHLAGLHRAGRPVTLRPLDHRRDCHAEARGHCAAALALRHRRYDALTQIIGERFDHPILASNPASILNHNPPDYGIPSDSINL